MSMETYDEIKVKVESWLNRTNFPALDIEIEDLMAMGQRRIFRTANLKAMEKKVTFLTSAPEVPSDYLRTKNMRFTIGNNTRPITGAPLIQVTAFGNSGFPTLYCIEAGEFLFGPVPNNEYEIQHTYYFPLPLLSETNATNWLSENIPELVLFATLLEASLWLKDDARAQVWEGRYNQTKTDLENSESDADKEGGALRVRGPGTVGGFESVISNSNS